MLIRPPASSAGPRFWITGSQKTAAKASFLKDLALAPVLLTAFAKNERTDLSQAERNDFRNLTKLLIETYRSRRA